jgi:hypothetical protein
VRQGWSFRLYNGCIFKISGQYFSSQWQWQWKREKKREKKKERQSEGDR